MANCYKDGWQWSNNISLSLGQFCYMFNSVFGNFLTLLLNLLRLSYFNTNCYCNNNLGQWDFLPSFLVALITMSKYMMSHLSSSATEWQWRHLNHSALILPFFKIYFKWKNRSQFKILILFHRCRCGSNWSTSGSELGEKNTICCIRSYSTWWFLFTAPGWTSVLIGFYWRT